MPHRKTGTTEARARENTTTEIFDTTALWTDTPETMKGLERYLRSLERDSATGEHYHEQGNYAGRCAHGRLYSAMSMLEKVLMSIPSGATGRVWNISLTREAFDSEGEILTEQPPKKSRKTAEGNRLYGSDPLCL